MNVLIDTIKKIDPENILEPFLERNAIEYESECPRDFLNDAWIEENCDASGVDEDARRQLLALAREVRENKTLSFLYFHCERLVFEFQEIYEGSKLAKWPSFDDLIPGKNELFLLLLALSAIPRIHLQHKSLGVPSDITAATCSDVGSRVLISREFKDGATGISLRCLNWLRHHVKGTLFQFGRLQFHLVNMGGGLRVYRNRRSGEYMAIVEPGKRLNAEGFHDGIGGNLSADHWYSCWDECDGVVKATRISPSGHSIREPVVFKLDEWDLVVDQNSIVMNTHIPRGPRIQLSDWRESILQGFDFFENKLGSTVSPVACICRSWMFEPRFQDILPETSNLVKLQKRLQLFTFLNSHATRSGFYFVFGDDDIDIETAPRDTSLRRALLDHVQSGGVITGGGMILMRDEVEKRLAD